MSLFGEGIGCRSHRAGRFSGRRSATRMLVAAGVVVAAWCVTVGAAHGAIVVGRTIARVHLGDTRARVIHKLGKPSRVFHIDVVTILSFEQPAMEVTVEGSPARVKSMTTTDHKQHTRKGIHPGSARSAVRAAYPNVKCGVSEIPGGGLPPVHYCDLGVAADGTAVRATRFVFAKKHLKSITICANCKFIVQQAPAAAM